MLRLLGTPQWDTPVQRLDLPNTLPGWTIAFLALKGDWVARDHLLALLWPDAGAQEAQHSLRVNLHRVRSILVGWGVADALQTERKRARLSLPTDVALLRSALNAADTPTLLAGYQRPLLASMSQPGFPALQEWVDLERDALHAAWRESLLSRVGAVDLGPADALAICQALVAVDPLDEEALAAYLRRLQLLGRTTEATRLYEAFRVRLAQELGTEPSASLRSLVTMHAANGAPTGHVPPGTRDAFVGRDLALSQLEAMLQGAEGCIVTLLGPGGVGKSRIAQELMRRLGSHWRDGATWVPLGELTMAAELLPRLAERLGLSPAPGRDLQAQVIKALTSRHGLIVLDNAEHLVDLPSLLATLRGAAAQVVWLVTSRAPLDVAHERTYTLEGMAMPDEGDMVRCSFDEARSFDAVRLLEMRVRAANPAFDLAEQWRDCLELLRTLGGWPLAIELAASVLARHDAASVLADLRQSIDTLAASRPPEQGRHLSVRASLELSWRLLGPVEQDVLARLSVFRGGFTRPAVLAVVATTASSLGTLLERSLVQVLGNGRFDLHPLVAQFAGERLADEASGLADALHRHADHFMARLCTCAQPDIAGTDAMLGEIEADFENFRKAWQLAVARQDADHLGRGVAAWTEFGAAKGRAAELAQLVAQAMPATVHDPAARSALLLAAASLRFRAGELDLAQGLARDGLSVAARAGDEACRRALLNTLALALKDLGRYDEAEQFAQEGLWRSRAAHIEREIALHANTCAILAKTRGDQSGAAALYEEAIAIHRRGAHHRSLAMCLNNLGNTLRALGDLPSAQLRYEESLRIAEQHGIASTRAFALVNLAIVHHQRGRHALVESFAQRARDEPAAEPTVLLAVDAVMVLTAIERHDFERARIELGALANRARQTGLHAAMLEAVGSHAKLLVAAGRREEAIARLAYLAQHPQLPALQRSDVQQILQGLEPTPEEWGRATVLAGQYELDALVEDAASRA